MVEFNIDNFNKGMGIAQGAIGMIGAGIGAYKNVPQASSVDPYMNNLKLSAVDYQPSSIEGLMMQQGATPHTQWLEGKDLYDPSSGQMFSSMLGAGMSMYGATKNFTDSLNLKGNMGTTYMNGASGFNTANNKGWGSLGKSIEEQQAAGRDFNGEQGQNMYMQEFNVPGANWGAYGGHLHAIGGMFDNGAMLGQGLSMAGAGLGLALNYAGMKAQERQANEDATVYNATKMFVDQRNKHNFNLAVEDSKNNMFNNQALQMMANGGYFDPEFPLNGEFNVIGNGGTHEQNPNNGVPQGVASDGQENLVEEGEVVWNDYVFSKRLTVPEKFRVEHKLKEDINFADAAQKLTEEAKERPNDPISQNGMEDILSSLRDEQEVVREKKRARDFKKIVDNMTPEEVMQMQAMLQQEQEQQQQESNPQQGINPQELEGMIAACGGRLKAEGGNLFDDGGDKIRERRLLETIGGKNVEQLRELAALYSGYDNANFTSTDINSVIDFILKQSSGNSYDDLQRMMDQQGNLQRLETDPDYTITNIDTTDWNALLNIGNNYTESKKRGNTAYKYNEDPRFQYQGKNTVALENDPEYRKFTEYVLSHSNDTNVQRYLKMLDEGINTENGTELLFGEDGRLKDNWQDLYTSRRNDQKGGIYHFFQNLKNKKSGERNIFRLNGQKVQVNDPARLSKFIRETGRTQETDFDDEGNLMTTNYIDLTNDKYSAEGTDDTPKKDIPSLLPTIPRYAPALGSFIGAMQALTEKPKDYSTNIRPYIPTYQPIGDYLAYNPVDTQRYLMANDRNFAAQRNAITNQSGANRNMAMAQMALANQQQQENMANIMNTAEQMNFARKAQVGEFNRGTNQFNASAFNALQPQMAQRDQLMLNQAQHNAQTRLHVDEALDAAKGQNLTNLFDNIGNIGRENLFFNMANNNRALDYKMGLNGYSEHKSSNGGLLTKRNRRK